ncbi:40S ribosomal protein S7 [Striga asiatica]|uniref:40S ribosomal protein S7 n=1 Tax=Striga asiatica TaxID=4170 RepID=A0A5A7RHL1_STRAF|nr:40S ribosomal protein S7 [Striga asiatica]
MALCTEHSPTSNSNNYKSQRRKQATNHTLHFPQTKRKHSHHIQFFKESPAPWKKQHDSAKSAMKIPTNDTTTAEVVDSPTPLAPPIVVTPHAQLTTDIIPPKTPDFIMELTMSHDLKARLAELNIILILTP